MSNKFYQISTKIKFRCELNFYHIVFTRHEIISVPRITNRNYILVKILLISHHSWQLARFSFAQLELSPFRENNASAHQLLLKIGLMKPPVAAEKFLVERVKHTLDNDSSDAMLTLLVNTVTALLELHH